MSKIQFKFNKEKAVEVILYLAQKRQYIDKISLYKFLFFADEIHLNKYGRPICGGHYAAMPLGPVPSQIKTLLERDSIDFILNDYWITPTREPNLDYLSETDKEALDLAYGKYSVYKPTQLSDISHEHRAWQNATRENPYKKNNPIDFKDLIDPCNTELIEDLEENSKYILI